jgi:hypothetical protein
MNDETLEPMQDELEEPVEGTEEVVPPPVIPPEPEEPQYSDEDLVTYAMQIAARNPELMDRVRRTAGGVAPAPVEPDEEPEYDDEYIEPTTQNIAALAEKIANKKIEPIVQQFQALQWQLQSESAAASIAKQIGGEAYIAPVKEELQKLGPAAVDAYQKDPDFRALFDDAMKHRARGASVKDDKPLPKSDGVVGSGPAPTKTKEAEEFDKRFAHMGLTYKDLG